MTQMNKLEALADALKTWDHILLLCHISPDGDTVGSALALALALRALNKRVCVSVPGGVPKLYAFMPGTELVADEPPFAPSAALAVDVSEKYRMGEAGESRFDACENTALIDHHPTNPGFGAIQYIEPSAAATGIPMLRLIRLLGIEPDAAMATCLYIAISTDCGNFNFSNTNAETLRAAADCIEAGADACALSKRLYRTRTFARTKLLGLVLAQMERSQDGRNAYARVTLDMLAEAGAAHEDIEGIRESAVHAKALHIGCSDGVAHLKLLTH